MMISTKELTKKFNIFVAMEPQPFQKGCGKKNIGQLATEILDAKSFTKNYN